MEKGKYHNVEKYLRQLVCALFRCNRAAFAAITPADLVSMERLGSGQFIKVPSQRAENTHMWCRTHECNTNVLRAKTV